MAMGQLPIVFLTAGRYSPLALVSGIDFADSMLYHRWLARMVWLQVSVHSFAYTYLEASSGDLAESFHEAYWNWGVAATSMFWGLTILAYGQLRTKAYEVFVALHVIMGVIVLVGIYFHIHLLDYWRYKVFIVLTEISAAVWAFDRVFRAANRIYISFRLRTTGSIATATLTTHADDLVRLRIRLPLSRLHLPGEQASSSTVLTRIAPGHSVRILVPRLQFFSDHPFTVIGTGRLPEAGDDIGFLDLLIRQQKGFTRHLSKLQSVDAGAVDVESGTIVKQSAVIVEGPSGEIHHDALRGASQVLLFSGGVGIAYTLPYLIETALSHPDVPCTLVWMIRDIALFHAVLVELNAAAKELAARSKAEQATSKIRRAPLLINLHITSRQAAMQEASDAVSELEKHPAATAPTSGEEDKDARSVSVDSSEEGKGATVHVESSCDHLKPYFHITTSYGRADPSSIITPPVAREQEQKQGQGQERGQLVVMSCGPMALCDDVRYETQRALASGAWRDVCYFEECFNW
ncbi:ferric-chelate reductase [Tilletia horrida]|nr:ferric-chelate reductase [Tilletia horrida]